jgi:hypothetical protein
MHWHVPQAQSSVRFTVQLLSLSRENCVSTHAATTSYTFGAIAILVRPPSDDPQAYRSAESVYASTECTESTIRIVPRRQGLTGRLDTLRYRDLLSCIYAPRGLAQK